MKLQVSFFFLFILQLFYGQNISVNVINKEKNKLSNINVQLLKNNKTLDFKTTNEIGICNFTIKEKGEFTLKLTSMLYKTTVVKINPDEKTNFEIILESQITEIQEVKIKTRPKIAFLKEDTISYNLKAIKDGTERTVEDLVRKLPGLDVDDNGKVTRNGNVVGQVLVDGNEFFGKNHKMATKNISADMIDGVDFWQNYTTISGSQSTALNLKLKNEYKGKITGNTEVYYGNKNSYLTHANLFRFNKSGNLALIADANSIAKDPIGTTDFYEMNQHDDVDNTNGIVRVATPSFLNNDGKVKEKNNQFGALQYSKSGKNFSVSAFSIFNTTQLEKWLTMSRIAFPEQPTSYNFFENRNEDNKGFFGTTQLKVKKMFRDKSYLYYSFGYNPSEDHFQQNIDRNLFQKNSFYELENKIKNSTVHNFISWSKKYSISRFNISFTQLKTKNTSVLDMQSSELLFGSPYNNLHQILDTDSEKYAFDINLKNNFSFATINFRSGYSFKKDDAHLSEFYTNESEVKSLKTHDFVNEIFVQKYLGSFDLSASLSSHYLHFNQTQKSYLDKTFKVQYKLNTKAAMNFGLEYLNRYKIPDFLDLLYDKNYSRSFSYTQNLSIFPETFINSDAFKFTFIRFNLNKGSHIFSVLMYEKGNTNITKDVTNFGAFSQVYNVLGTLNDRWFLLYSDDRRIGEYFILKSKLTAMLARTNNFINQQYNETSMKNLEIGQKASTKFKNFPIQFDFGYSLSKSFFNQSLYNTSSSLQNIKLSLGLRAHYKNEWLGNILGEYLIQKTGHNSLYNFLLGGQVSYRKTNSFLEYNLLFNNVLNLNNFRYINSSVSLLGTEESAITALHGYITAGIKVYF